MKANFQIILVAVFLAFAVFAVLIFSGILPIGNSTNSSTLPQGKVVIWGTFPSLEMGNAFDAINTTNGTLTIKYVEQPKDNYQKNLVEAFAAGT